jgi:hypothetical protein
MMAYDTRSLNTQIIAFTALLLACQQQWHDQAEQAQYQLMPSNG